MWQRCIGGFLPNLGRELRCDLYHKAVRKHSFKCDIHSIQVRCCRPSLPQFVYATRSIHNRPKDSLGSKSLKLMNINEIVWPNVFKTFKNVFLAFLIRNYYDSHFSGSGFLSGAEQAVHRVSTLISAGDFDSLDGLVTKEALREIKDNYEKLSPQQREFISIDPKDLFLKIIYEIGMIFDNSSQRRFVEITTVMQGYHGLQRIKDGKVTEISREMSTSPDQLYVCNYRFIREYTKGIEGSWIINELNHFTPRQG